jgi:uncharacterized protein YbaR (Trm112 family)
MDTVDLLCACPKCKMVYEIVRHHVRPATEPYCEACQQAFPVADADDWLTYRRVSTKFERIE